MDFQLLMLFPPERVSSSPQMHELFRRIFYGAWLGEEETVPSYAAIEKSCLFFHAKSIYESHSNRKKLSTELKA
jgi:hypothetical protein